MKEITYMHTQILAIICSVFDAYSASLYLPHEEEGQYALAATFSLGDSDDYCEAVGPDASLLGEIIRTNKPIVMMNYDKNQQRLGYYKDEEENGVKAFMGCSVPSGGVLCVDSKKLYSFSDKDSKILQLFADLVGKKDSSDDAERALPQDPATVAEYFACLGIVRSLRFQYKAWSTFLQNFLRTVAHAVRFEYCAFASLDPSEECYVLEGENRQVLLQGRQQLVFPIQTGMVGWVFRDEHQSIFSEGFNNNTHISLFGKMPGMPAYRALICIPVVVNKTARGVLCLAHSEGREMDESLRSFLNQSVDYLSLFLENLYLRSRLHQLLPQAQVHDQAVYQDVVHQSYSEEE